MAAVRSTHADEARAPQLEPCPKSPNCVSSLASDDGHRVEPLLLATDAAKAWRALRDAVTAMPRTRIAEERPRYLHAECRSRIFRFVDDFELVLDEAGGRVDVRSASRTGYGDMGVNRARVEELRAALVAGGAVKPAAAGR